MKRIIGWFVLVPVSFAVLCLVEAGEWAGKLLSLGVDFTASVCPACGHPLLADGTCKYGHTKTKEQK